MKQLLFPVLALIMFAADARATTPMIKGITGKLEVVCTDHYSIMHAAENGPLDLAQGGITWTRPDGLALMPDGRAQAYAKYERNVAGENHLIEFVVKDYSYFGINLEARYSITTDGRRTSASTSVRLEPEQVDDYLSGGKAKLPDLDVAINGRVPDVVEEMSQTDRKKFIAEHGYGEQDFVRQGIRCQLWRK